MTGHLHPGSHPDADSLSAFLEGVLPEHERLACLEHFAECADCREAVFLAQQPAAEPAAPKPVRGWGRWLAPIPVLSGALAAVALVLAVAYYAHRPAAAPSQYAVAQTPSQPIPAPPTPAVAQTERAQPSTMAKSRSEVQLPVPPEALASVHTDSAASPIAGGMAQFAPAAPATPRTVSPTALQAEDLKLEIRHNPGVGNDVSEVKGVVTDATGAAIPEAAVTLRQLATGDIRQAATNEGGRFDILAVPPGRYQVQIVKPGFRESSGQIELQPRDLAVLDSVLPVGTTSESVTVISEGAAAVQAENGAVSTTLNHAMADNFTLSGRDAGELMKVMPGMGTAASPPPPEPVAIGKRMLRADSSGALVFSHNAGKQWKPVTPLWQGKVAKLAIVTEPAAAGKRPVFQITTESGSVWLSRDGMHWHAAPAQH